MAAFLDPLDRQLGCTLSRNERRESFCLCRRDIARTDLARIPALESTRAIHTAREKAASRYVDSNRLHAHILVCLIGVPNLLFDNSYGKCSDYSRTWHSELEFARLVTW
jgi:exopolysaccharide biosynthesis predicted pyruvyltransferase EpsI